MSSIASSSRSAVRVAVRSAAGGPSRQAAAAALAPSSSRRSVSSLAFQRLQAERPALPIARPLAFSVAVWPASGRPLAPASSSSRSFSVQGARRSKLQIACVPPSRPVPSSPRGLADAALSHARLSSDITEHEYAPIADETMHALHDSLEVLVEGDEGAAGGWEVEYSVSPLACCPPSDSTPSRGRGEVRDAVCPRFLVLEDGDEVKG